MGFNEVAERFCNWLKRNSCEYGFNSEGKGKVWVFEQYLDLENLGYICCLVKIEDDGYVLSALYPIKANRNRVDQFLACKQYCENRNKALDETALGHYEIRNSGAVRYVIKCKSAPDNETIVKTLREAISAFDQDFWTEMLNRIRIREDGDND